MSLAGLLRFLAGRFKLNLKASFEYRASFWSQVLFMIFNNAFLLWFWRIFFAHFGAVRDWKIEDMYLLYGISATAFGLANTFAGNSMELSGLVADGELDYFIGLPPPTLLHALVTRLRVSALGDVAFGLSLLTILYHGSPARLALSLAVCIPAALVFVSFSVLGASMAFVLGESRGISFQLVNLLLTFSTYPDAIFQGSLRWVLYLLVPAGLFTHLPAHVLRHAADPGHGELALSLLKLLAGALGFLAAALFAFDRGLKRYASGSSLGIRI
jgi:ABC-2 type transport system permease protein